MTKRNKHISEPYFKPFMPRVRIPSPEAKKPEIGDFDNVPTLQLCQSIQVLIDELTKRDVRIINWDDKNKFFCQLYFLNGKIFFLEDEICQTKE